MMSNKGQPGNNVICPYNSAHTIIPHRLQTHLVKCRKNYPNTKIVMCMHNSTHRIHEPELAFHHDNCPDRLGLDKFMFAPTTINEEKFEIPIVDLQPTETWEDDERESYNPEEHCLNNPILRKKDTLSKAQRKNFRFEERQRMQQFYSNNENKRVVDETPPTAVVGGGQPRRPNTFSKGLDSKTDLIEDDVSDLMKKIHLGANTATVPLKKEPSKNVAYEPENIPNNIVESHDMNSYPLLPHSSGLQLGHGAKPKKSVRGRGSAFRNN